ncbi:hypothetical protein TK1117 [Thermococcus kodakarensis KOD1]|uniref:Uncharacterized protein n=1 Tax=Thermococcus kodakarensis (strain ATCC BAA-918 / JCM 12380 / KOD1) TaxID=69014 RepID=Q5JE67_THEKO|nr:hypothetical protein [Thermococcus kodakarensis]WCN29067.1 hypothetical protein POG15_05655 [Thermococcus kodakarensis]WCN31372.1 hypothetical protein POG21_05655 [Thermococcus kodakarensis]BAD85306.1 hypothetical protein TK1117 [Thermococcus kodakarensis KOD1]
MGRGMTVDANRVIAGGVLVFVEPETFKKFLELKERPLVIVGETGGFKKVKLTMTTYDGALIITRGEVELSETAIVVKARELSLGK